MQRARRVASFSSLEQRRAFVAASSHVFTLQRLHQPGVHCRLLLFVCTLSPSYVYQLFPPLPSSQDMPASTMAAALLGCLDLLAATHLPVPAHPEAGSGSANAYPPVQHDRHEHARILSRAFSICALSGSGAAAMHELLALLGELRKTMVADVQLLHKGSLTACARVRLS